MRTPARSAGWPLLVAGLFALAAKTADAGPWSKRPGQAYIKMGQSVFWADNFVAGDGTVVDGVSHLGLTTSLYAEAGILGGLQAMLYLPLYHGRNSIGSIEYSRTSAGDASLGLQYQLPRVPFPISLRGELKLPMYSLERTFEIPAPGDGQIDLTFWLSAGGSFGALPLYGFVELGYRHRTEAYLGDDPMPPRSYDDGLALAAQVGYRPLERWLLGLNVSGIIPIDANDITKGYLNLGPFSAISVYRRLAVELSFDAMVYARSSVRGFSGSVGLSYSLD